MLTIKPNELEAIALASSKEQTRYYLNGVCIETYADGTCGLIATDGHRLHTINTQDSPVSSFILGTDDVKKAVAMAKAEEKSLGRYSKETVKIGLELTGVILNVSIITVDKDDELQAIKGTFTTKTIDGNFPDWRRILPSSFENAGSEIAFNPVYMADFAKVAKLLNGSTVKLQISSKESPMVISVSGATTFTGVLMPMRF